MKLPDFSTLSNPQLLQELYNATIASMNAEVVKRLLVQEIQLRAQKELLEQQVKASQVAQATQVGLDANFSVASMAAAAAATEPPKEG